VKSAGDFPLLVRLANPICSYGRYLVKAFWPGHMVIFYPMPPVPPWAFFVVSLLVIVACTWLAFRWRDRFPWFGVGWFWFLGTLVPVIGIVQVGNQAMADRYTYIPYIGLFIMVAWGVDSWMEKQPSMKWLAMSASVMALVVFVAVTRNQLGYWRDSISVFSHATNLTSANKFSNGNLSYALAEAKRGDDAIPRYEALLSVQMKQSESDRPLMYDTASIGKRDDEVTQLLELLNHDSNNAIVYNNLGIVLSQQGKPDEAIAQFDKATQEDPKSPWAYFNEAVVLQERGRAREAAAHYAKAIDLRPAWPEALDKLAYLLATCPKDQEQNPAKAIELATKANELTDRTAPGYLHTLAIAYAAGGSFSNAVTIGELGRQKAQTGGFQVLAANLQREVRQYETEKVPVREWQKPPTRVILSRKKEVLAPL
jgi:protein O-mannosyl-transferase